MPVLQSLRAIADDGWLGSLMVQQIPDDTIALSNLCTEQQLSDDEQHKIRVALLQQSVLLSEITLPRYVRYLVSAKDSLVLKALSAAAFRSAGPVEEWTRSEKMTTGHCLPPVGCVFYWIDAADISTESSAHFTRFSTRTSIETSAGRFEVSQPVLCGLLDQSLQHSNDLPGLPLPTADQLLRLWRLSSSTIRIFLAVQNNEPVGIMAMNLVEDGSDAVGPEIIIEYIGVRCDSRRNGIAAALLSLLASEVSGSPPPARITAFAGAENEAAAGLYRRLGFAVTDSLAVWTAAGP